MSKSPETQRPKLKLFTGGKFFLALIALLSGIALFIIRDYRVRGSVSGSTLGASAVAFVIGLIILLALGRYANKPEECYACTSSSTV